MITYGYRYQNRSAERRAAKAKLAAKRKAKWEQMCREARR